MASLRRCSAIEWSRDQGRVNLVHGDAQEIFPGITAYTGGKHTWQSQFLSIATAAGGPLPATVIGCQVKVQEFLCKISFT